jgi:histidine triad (HIT) family protein
MEENKCIFCQIASGATKSNVIYEDEKLTAVLDINPATNGHVIVIPKTHYGSLYAMPQIEYLAFLSITRAIAYALILSMGATNVDMIYTQELTKGNFTPHALIHAIPRYTEDTVNYVWQRTTLNDEQAAQTSTAIKDAFEKVKAGGESEFSYETPQPVQVPKPQAQTQPVPPKQEAPKKPELPPEKPPQLKKKIVVF